MTRLERAAVLAILVALLLALLSVQPVFTALGTAGGVAAGVAVSQRLGRLRARVDAVIGADEAPARGFRLEAVVRRGLVQVGVLGVVLVLTAFIPFAGDRAFAALAAAATALPAVLTAERLRRPHPRR
jgi:hypothetical protein